MTRIPLQPLMMIAKSVRERHRGGMSRQKCLCEIFIYFFPSSRVSTRENPFVFCVWSGDACLLKRQSRNCQMPPLGGPIPSSKYTRTRKLILVWLLKSQSKHYFSQHLLPTIFNTKQGWARCPPLPVQWEKKKNDVVANALGRREAGLM